MDHSTMMIYRFIWQCDARHIDIIWDIVISLFDPVLDSMPCSFFKRYIQSTALQARGRVCRVKGTQHWVLLIWIQYENT